MALFGTVIFPLLVVAARVLLLREAQTLTAPYSAVKMGETVKEAPGFRFKV